jgi:hypothetical protein
VNWRSETQCRTIESATGLTSSGAKLASTGVRDCGMHAEHH